MEGSPSALPERRNEYECTSIARGHCYNAGFQILKFSYLTIPDLSYLYQFHPYEYINAVRIFTKAMNFASSTLQFAVNHFVSSQ